MPTNYFSAFPLVTYDPDGSGVSMLMLDIMHRARFREAVLKNITDFYQWTIRDGETPELIAAKYYKASRLFWLVLLPNEALDPYFDWPMTYTNFNAYITKQYGATSIAQQTVHHYEDDQGNIIDLTTYNNTPSENRKLVDVYTYHFDLNESKRRIRLVDRTFATQIENELINILSGR